MNDQSFLFQRKAFSRRNFVRGLSTAGAGLVVGSKLITPALAQEEEDEGQEPEASRPVGLYDTPFPIPHVAANGAHFFFPGKVEGIDADHGHDPSLITDFNGFIGEADLNLTGTGTRLTGDFLETSATIEVTATTPPETGHGFRFVSDAPETTETLFAQIGRERNGGFFS